MGISSSRLWVVLACGGSACDPGYEYCAVVTDCTTGSPIADARVRFDHVGLYDTNTDAAGKACSANIGAAPSRDVVVIVRKDGYATLTRAVRSQGDTLEAHLCLSQLSSSSTTSRDAGQGGDSGTGGDS